MKLNNLFQANNSTNSPILKPSSLIFISTQFIAIVLIIFFFVTYLQKQNPDSSVTITNESAPSTSDLPNEKLEIAQRSLFGTISLNTSQSIDKNGAAIRDGSQKSLFFEKYNVHYYYAIIDVPSLKQSYQMSYLWSDNISNEYIPPNNPVRIMCPRESQLIYGNFDCRDKFDGTSDKEIIQNILSYYEIGELGINTKITDSDLIITIYTPNQEYPASQAETDVKNFISSLGFDPDDYQYNIPAYGFTNVKS